MSKKPDPVTVSVTVSDISFQIPKAIFEQGAVRVAVFVGRKGKGSLTRHTKWFTVADPSDLPTTAQHDAVATPVEKDKSSEGARSNSAYCAQMSANRGANGSAVPMESGGDMVILKFGKLSAVKYDIEMQPLNKYEGEWVFDQKMGHPLSFFAKVFVLRKPGADAAANVTEMDSNPNELLAVYREELDEEDEDDKYSGSDVGDMPNGEENEALAAAQREGAEMGFTAEQLALLTGDDRSDPEIMVEKLIKKQDPEIVKRYMSYPRVIDVSSTVNTKTKAMLFSDRVKSKSGILMGSMLSFTVSADLPLEELAKFEEKQRERENKEARKRREKEEKLMEKERKKQREKEVKEREAQRDENERYGVDVGNSRTNAGIVKEKPQEAKSGKGERGQERRSSGFIPLDLVKNIFSSKENKSQPSTPFPVKYRYTPYPFIIILEKFALKKLTMAPEYYRGVNIRLGVDRNSTDAFPLLMLNTTKGKVCEETVTGFDGHPKTRKYVDFGSHRICFADKKIRKITGFETLRGIREFEKHPRPDEDVNEKSAYSENADVVDDGFQTQILNVGEKFVPVQFEPLKYSANDAQVQATKYTRVIAQLILPKDLQGVQRLKSEEEERKDFIKEKKKEFKNSKKNDKEPSVAPLTAEEEVSGVDVPDNVAENRSSELETESEEGKFESTGEAHVGGTVEADKKPKTVPTGVEPTVTIGNQTSSFQLGTYMLNEEYVPKQGFRYFIRFQTGEELWFSARRRFLPAMCSVGPQGSILDASILDKE